MLHALRMQRVLDGAALVEATGLAAAEVEQLLSDLASDGLVERRDGRRAGHALTRDGRPAAEAALAAELDAHGVRGEVEAAYERFVVLNPELLEVCTAWQLREVDGQQVPNDHSDPAHDAEVIERLVDLDQRAQPVCEGLAEALLRLGRYGPSLAHAVARVQAGEHEWFTRPMMPSYHSVWFELHEDLLATLGLDRAGEAVP